MYWSYILMAVGVVGLYFIGKVKKIGWYINVFAQILWVIYALITQQYGFIISATAYAFVYIRGLLHFDFLAPKNKLVELDKSCPDDNREYVSPAYTPAEEKDGLLVGRVVVPRGVSETHDVEIEFHGNTEDHALIYEVRGYPKS